MTMYERTGFRSLLYSSWHRPPSLSRYLSSRLASRLHVIDIDWCEYCDVCKAPLALIETQESTHDPKSARVTATLARMAGITAYSVSYWPEGEADIGGFKVRRLEPPNSRVVTLTAAEYAQWLASLRITHTCGEVRRQMPHQRKVAS